MLTPLQSHTGICTDWEEDRQSKDAQLLELDDALGAIKNSTYWDNDQPTLPMIVNFVSVFFGVGMPKEIPLK